VSIRKPHQGWAGYKAERRNPWSGGHTVILDCRWACQQGVPLVEDWMKEGGRYQVVCDSHSVLCHFTSMPKAREAMRDPTVFCLDCRSLAGE
jgi:hypothetical protein